MWKARLNAAWKIGTQTIPSENAAPETEEILPKMSAEVISSYAEVKGSHFYRQLFETTQEKFPDVSIL